MTSTRRVSTKAPGERRTSGTKSRATRTTPTRGRAAKRFGLTLLAIIAIVAVAGVAGCSALTSSLPDMNAAKARGRDQSTVILDSKGRQLARLYAEQNRSDKPLAVMPLALRQAVISTEDQRFYEHAGVDPIGVTRALFNDIVLRRPSQGGSTITQQYVKNAFGSTDKTLSRKLQEAMLANKLEQTYTKDQILELYLNTIYFGHGAYGVESASQTYFGKHVESLTLPEAAMIAGVIKSPAHYSPYLDPAAAKLRRDTVLGQMRDQSYITPAQFATAEASSIKTTGLKARSASAPYFVEWIKEQVGTQFGQELLYRGGLTIRTTLDLNAQKAAEKAVAGALDKKGDPSAALVALKPGSGAIVAMVGGRDFTTQQFNAAVQGQGRQPGSAFKPFVLATALANGVSPEQTFSSGPIKIPVDGSVWSVTGSESGQDPMRLRMATEKSVNSVFAQLIMKTGPKKVVATAEELGLHSGIKPVPAIALGGLDTGVTPLEMADAYATFAANGKHADPYGITEITDPKGQVLFSAKPKTDQAIPAPVAYLTTDILKGVITDGTGKGADIGRPAAGKTGTTQSNRDAWFVGYTPALSAAVWVGYVDSQREMASIHGRTVTGGSFPAEIWSKFMSAALAGTAADDFSKPPGLKKAEICLDTGLAATQYCPSTGSALFLADTELSACNKHTAPAKRIVPDVVGMTKADAVAALGKLKLTVKVSENSVAGSASGKVTEQSPKAGTVATDQTVVTITVGTNAVSKTPPTAVIDMPATSKMHGKVALDGGSSKAGGKVVKWYWEFGDGATASGATTSHSWSTMGNFEVTLWVTDDAGQRASVTKTIKIQ